VNQAVQCPGDGEGGRSEQLAQYQREQAALARGKREENVALQVTGDQIVEVLLVVGRRNPASTECAG